MFPVVTVYRFPSPVAWRVKAGTTLRGYDPGRPNVVIKEIRFDRDSVAHADARVGVTWLDVPPGQASPIPRGYPFLRVSDGVFVGLLIVEAQVQFEQLPDPIKLARAAALEEARAAALRALEEARTAAIRAVGEAIDALPR